VPIHRHLESSETVICLEGCLDWIFYEELPNMDAGGPIHDGEIAQDETNFKETVRFRVCPREGQYGIQIPPMAWHTLEVHEPSTIFEAKDGAYGK
jgi:cupin fold WbuC family metalloprotein